MQSLPVQTNSPLPLQKSPIQSRMTSNLVVVVRQGNNCSSILQCNQCLQHLNFAMLSFICIDSFSNQNIRYRGCCSSKTCPRLNYGKQAITPPIFDGVGTDCCPSCSCPYPLVAKDRTDIFLTTPPASTVCNVTTNEVEPPFDFKIQPDVRKYLIPKALAIQGQQILEESQLAPIPLTPSFRNLYIWFCLFQGCQTSSYLESGTTGYKSSIQITCLPHIDDSLKDVHSHFCSWKDHEPLQNPLSGNSLSSNSKNSSTLSLSNCNFCFQDYLMKQALLIQDPITNTNS